MPSIVEQCEDPAMTRQRALAGLPTPCHRCLAFRPETRSGCFFVDDAGVSKIKADRKKFVQSDQTKLWDVVPTSAMLVGHTLSWSSEMFIIGLAQFFGLILVLNRQHWFNQALGPQPCRVCGEQIVSVNGGWVHVRTGQQWEPKTLEAWWREDVKGPAKGTDAYYHIAEQPHCALPILPGDPPPATIFDVFR